MIFSGRSTTLVFILLGTAIIPACSSRSPQSTNLPANNDQVFSETPPFQTKEPPHYKAVRTFTFVDANGHATTTRKVVARYDDLRREEMSEHLVILDSATSRVVMLPESRIYSDVSGSESPISDANEIENSAQRLLHTDVVATSYQKLGTETISSRTATKYRVVVNGSAGENVSRSETLIWIDESLGMPIRSETKATDGSSMVVELSEIQLDVDKSLFQIPAGYEKVAIDELRGRLTKIKK